jgi:hypothetical protein
MPEQLITQDCTQAEQVLRKTCSKCKYPKPLIEMVKQRGSPDGLSSWCITCFNKANRIRSLERTRSRQKLINLLKEDPCMDCGNKFPPCCMDFDHVRGAKELPISKMYTCAWSRVLLEVSKCDLVCACCHRIRTLAQKRAA